MGSDTGTPPVCARFRRGAPAVLRHTARRLLSLRDQCATDPGRSGCATDTGPGRTGRFPNQPEHVAAGQVPLGFGTAFAAGAYVDLRPIGSARRTLLVGTRSAGDPVFQSRRIG